MKQVLIIVITDTLMKCWLCGLCLIIFSRTFSQIQACPPNINFSSGYLTNWSAYTGNNMNGNGPHAIKKNYPADNGSTNTLRAIFEYNYSVLGIQVLTTPGTDPFGGFVTIPTINGYQYNYSLLLGSTSVSRGLNNGRPEGGYIRGVSYKINVPKSTSSQPYTMTYAYAMVLENGTHNSNEQPLFSATLSIGDSVISCASPSYYLPTFGEVSEGERGAALDSATAKKNGFTVSSKLSPNINPAQNGNGGVYLQDVWTKGWTEVTFDLSPYRGQQVTLTFEADNCIPGGHFAYAYIALRNNCSGLLISGDSLVCVGTNVTYSVPALAGAKYEWGVPNNWQITSESDTSNIIHAIAGSAGGFIIAREQNSCADLKDTIAVKTTPPGIGGNLSGDATVCAGDNTSPLLLSGYFGNIVKWISSQDGVNWADISDISTKYVASDLTTTTLYKALVQNGTVCAPDSSSTATIIVDPKSVGGNIDPAQTNICQQQTVPTILNLVGNTGGVVNWQSSQDSFNWQDLNPQNTNLSYSVPGINVSTQYRVIVKSGVCEPDTSAISSVKYFPDLFPQAFIDPTDTTICYGTSAPLNALINIGTSYTWTNFDLLKNLGNGNVSGTPFTMQAIASPLSTTDFVLSVKNENCPNPLLDTFHVVVLPRIVVNAGRDTNVVANQPLQLQASSNDSLPDTFTWLPTLGLDNPNIYNPVSILSANIDTVRYVARATNAIGCYGEDDILVRVFKTAPDIFVPNAFTPGKNINNIFRPIPVGISSLTYFRIYDRWGHLVYTTSQIGQGWDGTVGGKAQDSDSFVWVVQGTDYTGKTIFKKGVMVLIR